MSFKTMSVGLSCSDCGNELRLCYPEEGSGVRTTFGIKVIPCEHCMGKVDKLREAIKNLIDTGDAEGGEE